MIVLNSYTQKICAGESVADVQCWRAALGVRRVSDEVIKPVFVDTQFYYICSRYIYMYDAYKRIIYTKVRKRDKRKTRLIQ